MLNNLIKVARRLDSFGLTKEARLLRSIIKSASEDVSPKAHHVGLMARNRAQDEGRPFHTWDAEYDAAVEAYREANPEYFDEPDLSGEGKFSDDAWDDGSTEPYHFKNTEGDEERKAKEEREWNLMLYGEEDPTPDKIAKREEERHNVSYYGTPEGHSAVRYNPHTGKYTNVWYTK